jgi:hypothetical protein
MCWPVGQRHSVGRRRKTAHGAQARVRSERGEHRGRGTSGESDSVRRDRGGRACADPAPGANCPRGGRGGRRQGEARRHAGGDHGRPQEGRSDRRVAWRAVLGRRLGGPERRRAPFRFSQPPGLVLVERGGVRDVALAAARDEPGEGGGVLFLVRRVAPGLTAPSLRDRMQMKDPSDDLHLHPRSASTSVRDC